MLDQRINTQVREEAMKMEKYTCYSSSKYIQAGNGAMMLL
jgi:hypothetical protein